VITAVLAENPRREGTTGNVNFTNYVVGETVAQFLGKEGAHMGHLRWDAARGFITVDFIADPVVEKPIKEEKEKAEPKPKKAKKEKVAPEA
jgi:hypothetical protein